MVIQFCQENNLIGKFKSCRACEHPCHQKKMRKSYAWRCRNTKCRTCIIIKLLGESPEKLQNTPPPHGKNGFLNYLVITSARYNKFMNTKKII